MAITFQVQDTLYSMDATTDISYSLTATLSSSPMADNTTQSDNIRVNVPTVRMDGVITDVKTYRSVDSKSTANWVDGVVAIMESGSSVALKYREDKDAEFGWFITAFNDKQNTKHGVGAIGEDGNVVQAFAVSMTFQKPVIALGLEATTQPPERYRDALSSKKEKASSTQTYNDDVKGGTARDESAKKAEELRGLAAYNSNVFLTGDTSPPEVTP